MSYMKCCVPGCSSATGTQTLHNFPNPAKDLERFQSWLFHIGGDILALPNEYIYKNRRICRSHFEDKYCCRFNRISNAAIPTVNMPGARIGLSTLKCSHNASMERRPLREVQILPEAGPSMLKVMNTPSPYEEGMPIENVSYGMCSQNISMYKSKMAEEGAVLNQSTQVDSHANTIADCSNNELRIDGVQDTVGIPKSTPYVAKPANKHKRMTPEEQRLYQKLIQTRIKLSKCRNLVKKQSANLKAAKNIAANPALLKTIEKLPSAAKVLTMMQFREVKKKNKGRRFSLQEKIIALSIFKQAPKGYRFLRKIFILPAPQTLAKLISQANINPGINKNIFAQLKNVAEKMKTEERLCILLFDEMFLKANLTYNERKDKTIGFITDGKNTKPEFADHAQVYMIRGLIKNFKQPVSYTFSAAATSGQHIATQLKQVVQELQNIGLIVIATVCDQGANNRLALKLLQNETRGAYLRKGQEPKENVILINDQEVIPLYDPPHLLKCIRNNLLTKNLEYISNGKKCTAKWQHLISLHKENPGYKGLRLIPKLTDHHVLPDKVAKNKMKVKFATQIFSRTIATNMGYLADKGIITKECSETADILLFFDNLFDSQNGSYSKKEKKFAKPLLGPVTPKSAHHQQWAEAKQRLLLMKFIHPQSGKVENVPTLKNWAWTLDGTEVLLKKLKKDYDITSVWMRHLNQDPIENFFGAIRSHGCRSTNPTPEKFEGAYTSLLINNMSSIHAPVGANCENDYCKNLHALIVTDGCKATTTCDLDFLPSITIIDIKSKEDPRIMGPLQYVSGYFIRNAKKKVFRNCKDCAKNVIAIEGAEYIKYREYAGRQWLCSPTQAVVNCVSAIQDITNTIIKECLHKNNIKEFIKTNIMTFVEFDFLDCEEHKENLINYLINLTTRFFLYNYCKDLNKILSGKRDICDDEDTFQIKAKKYYKKCCKRPVK